MTPLLTLDVPRLDSTERFAHSVMEDNWANSNRSFSA